MNNFLLTSASWWVYSLPIIELSMNWFSGQVTERTPLPSGFFTSGICGAFLWACRMGGTKVPAGTLFQSANLYGMPTLCMQDGLQKTTKEELSHDIS